MYLILLSWHFNFLPGFTYQQTFQRRTVHTPSCFHFNRIHLLLFNWHLISFQCSHCDRHFQTFQVFTSKQQPAPLTHTTFTVCIWFTSTFFQKFLSGLFIYISYALTDISAPLSAFNSTDFVWHFDTPSAVTPKVTAELLSALQFNCNSNFLQFLYFNCQFNLNLA